MDWPAIAQHFEPDGSLRDIYVLESSKADWEAVWGVLRDWDPPAAFAVDGVAEPMPARLETVLSLSTQHSVLLTFHVRPMRLNCHFFTLDEIEFDLDPREVRGSVEADLLAGFLRLLGDITGKTVVLTEENSREDVVAHCSVGSSDVVWTASQPRTRGAG